MSRKPDRMTAMQQIIDAVKAEFPLYQPDTFKCGPDNTCIGVSIHRNSIDTGKMRRSSLDPTFLLA